MSSPPGNVTVWCTPAPTTKSRARAVRSGPGAEASTEVTPIASRAGTASEGTSSGSGTRSRPACALSGCGLLAQSRKCARLRILTGECLVEAW